LNAVPLNVVLSAFKYITLTAQRPIFATLDEHGERESDLRVVLSLLRRGVIHLRQAGSKPVMIKVFESVGEPANLLDDEIDGFGVAVADAVGVEIGQDLSLPGAEDAAKPGVRHLPEITTTARFHG
jgi:hypothetical protein